ncbi:MAG TPA: formyltransferase [Candidatus Binataceae bacterium]|nr:formyltransferase [Candidatus Binataceae bacterium]
MAVSKAHCVVFGYHEAGYACISELLALGAPISALFTHHDSPTEEIWWRSCATLAHQHGIPVFVADRLDGVWLARIASMRPSVIYSFFYRALLPEELLNIAPLGSFNLHPSLLPKYRGRSPVNWMIINGEQQAGVTLHHMVARADAGDIVAQQALEIAENDTALTLYQKLIPLGASIIREYHPLIVTGRAPRRAQDLREGSYFGRRRPEDGRIDWNWPAQRIFNLVRGVAHPYPGAFSFISGHKLMIWEARVAHRQGSIANSGCIIRSIGDSIEVAAGEGSLLILRAQLNDQAEATPMAALRRAGLPLTGRLQ